MDYPLIITFIVGLLILYRVSISLFFAALIFCLLGLSNLLSLSGSLLTDLTYLRWGPATLILLATLSVWLFRSSRWTLAFLGVLVTLHFLNLLMPTQAFFHHLTVQDKRPSSARIFCPLPLDARSEQLYQVTDNATGLILLVKAGREAQSGKPAVCASTGEFFPLPFDRFIRADTSRDIVAEYIHVTDYRVRVNYPSLRKPVFIFPASTAGGYARLPSGVLYNYGLTVQTLR